MAVMRLGLTTIPEFFVNGRTMRSIEINGHHCQRNLKLDTALCVPISKQYVVDDSIGYRSGVATSSISLLSLVLLNHRKHLRMIQRSVCARVGKRLSSSLDSPRSNLLLSASKAGQRSHTWSYVSSSSLHIRHVASSDGLIRCCQRRRAGWVPLRKRLR